MNRQRRFVLAAVALVGVVGYLMVTGMKDSMTYYFTPAELVARVKADPTAAETGVKVGGRVVPGSVTHDARTLNLRFLVAQIDTSSADGLGEVRFPVHYTGPLPDTFEEGRDVVVEGKYTAGGAFEASTVLTKCGSRYEAAEEDFRS